VQDRFIIIGLRDYWRESDIRTQMREYDDRIYQSGMIWHNHLRARLLEMFETRNRNIVTASKNESKEREEKRHKTATKRIMVL